MRFITRTFTLAAAFFGTLGILPVRAQAPVRLEARPAFEGMAPGAAPYPVVISLANMGPDTEGVLSIEPRTVMDSRRRYDYALPLPGGAVKRVMAYPMASALSELSVAYRGDFRGRVVEATLPIFYESAFQVGLVSDRPGGLAALHALKPKKRPGDYSQRQAIPCSARPEDAPDRATGYAALDVLALAEGAERMQPAQWDAIRRWTLGGGTLILSGGPGAAWLRMEEARALSPLQRTDGATASALRLGAFGPTLDAPVGLATGSLKPGARALLMDSGRVLIAEMRLGAGRVVLTAFSVVEPPFRTWSGKAAFWNHLLERELAGRGTVWYRAMTQGNAANLPPGAIGGPGTERDPFQVQLPPTRLVAGLFLAYFVLVVPVSYVALRRMRRLEWAWATGPLLSVAFASAFGLFAADLYQAGLSRKTQGLLVASADGKAAEFIGSTEIFFPRGGRYALRVPNAEMLEPSPIGEDPYGYRRTSGSEEPFVTTDTGAVEALNYRVPNLAFRKVFYAAPVEWGGLSGTIVRDRKGGLTGRIRNDTAYTLTDVTLLLPGKGVALRPSTLPPGGLLDLARIPDSANRKAGTEWLARLAVPPLADGTDQRTALLIARTEGAPFGPPMGRAMGGEGVDVIVTLPYTQGGM